MIEDITIRATGRSLLSSKRNIKEMTAKPIAREINRIEFSKKNIDIFDDIWLALVSPSQ